MFVLITPILIIALHVGLLIDPPATQKVVAQTWHSLKVTATSEKDNLKQDFDLTCKTSETFKEIKEKNSKLKEVKLNKKGPFHAIMKFHKSKATKAVDEVIIPKSADCLIHKKSIEKPQVNSMRDS